MKEELDKKLVEDFPLLYSDRNGDMRSTCMCWGFPGSGWEPLLRRLSEKLEPLIRKFYNDNRDNILCATCGCEPKKHYGYIFDPGKCLAINKIPKFTLRYRWYKWNWFNKLAHKFVHMVDHVLGLFFYELQTCWCDQYKPNIPRAVQVKEKYGTLRFYMTGGTDEMYKLVEEAEKESEHTCEWCGKEGLMTSYGWLRTLCSECGEECKKDKGY